MNNSLQIRRIQNEVVEMKKNPSDMYVASPLEVPFIFLNKFIINNRSLE